MHQIPFHFSFVYYFDVCCQTMVLKSALGKRSSGVGETLQSLFLLIKKFSRELIRPKGVISIRKSQFLRYSSKESRGYPNFGPRFVMT